MAPVPLGIFAHPEIWACEGTPPGYEVFAESFPCVGGDWRDLLARGFSAAGLVPPCSVIWRTASDFAQLAVIRAGIAQTALALGLARLFPKIAPEMPAWIVKRKNLKRTARVRAAFDHPFERLL